MSQIIAMWSGPRNLSTAMMRSFGARSDMAVLDEPFFAPFLAVSGKDHPGRLETLERHENDPIKVAKSCLAPAPNGKPFYFQKHMPHHMLPGFPLDWAKTAKHFFLIRDPLRVIASYAKGRAAFDLGDLGYQQQAMLFERLTNMTGMVPPILDYMDILQDPKSLLMTLCDSLQIEWSEDMLSWKAGRRETDGAWAPYWYSSVENSMGFSPPPKAKVDIADQYLPILEAAEADYQALYQRRLKP